MGQGGSLCYEENELNRLNAHEKKVTYCSVAPDNKTLATCSTDGKINLWNLSTGEQLHTLCTPENWEVTSLAFSGSVMATSHSPPKSAEEIKDGLVYLWRYQTTSKQPKPRRSSRLASHHGGVLQCAFSRDGNSLASVSRDRTGRLYKIRPGAGEFVPGTKIKKLVGHSAAVNTVQFSPDNVFVVTGSDDTTIRVWRATQDQPTRDQQTRDQPTRDQPTQEEVNVACVATLHSDGPVRNVCFSPVNGNMNSRAHMACISANQIEVWRMVDYGRYEKRHELEIPMEKRLAALTYVPDGKHLVSTYLDNTVVIWDPVSTRKPITKRTGNKEGIYSCCFNSTGQIFVVGDGVGSVHIWGEQEDEQQAATFV